MNVVRSSALSALLLSLLLSVGPAPASGRSFSRTLTVRVPPGDVHCLYISDVGVGDQIEVAFEVSANSITVQGFAPVLSLLLKMACIN